MDRQEFFQPTWSKVLLALVLVFLFAPIVKMSCKNQCTYPVGTAPEDCKSKFQVPASFAIAGAVSDWELAFAPNPICNYSLAWPETVSSLVLGYILSCLVIFGLNRCEQKKKKTQVK